MACVATTAPAVSATSVAFTYDAAGGVTGIGYPDGKTAAKAVDWAARAPIPTRAERREARIVFFIGVLR